MQIMNRILLTHQHDDYGHNASHQPDMFKQTSGDKLICFSFYYNVDCNHPIPSPKKEFRLLMGVYEVKQPQQQ